MVAGMTLRNGLCKREVKAEVEHKEVQTDSEHKEIQTDSERASAEENAEWNSRSGSSESVRLPARCESNE
eukprot:4199934-Amphidinium_carterae.1